MNLGDKIKGLRMAKGLSLNDLANLTGVSKPAIQQYENGATKPSNKVLKAIAAALKVGVWDFYEIELKDFSLDSIKFRDGHLLNDEKNERSILKSETLDAFMRFCELEEIMGEKKKFDSSFIDMVENFSDVEKAAKKVRKKFQLGASPIVSVVGFLEGIGIKIIGVNRDTNSPAACGWVGEDPVVIINESQNHNWEITRRRFSTLHEAGHLFFRDMIEESVEESYCNRFAAAMLLPEEAAISMIGKNRTTISLGELHRVKETYGISIESIIYRLADLRLINQRAKDLMLEEYKTWRLENENFGEYTKSKEEPKKFLDLLRKALTEGRIDRYKANEISKINIDDLRDKLMLNKKIDLI